MQPQSATLNRMAKRQPRGEQPAGEAPKDRHKSKTMARLPEELYKLLKDLADERQRPLSWELRIAAINHLVANGVKVPAHLHPGKSKS